MNQDDKPDWWIFSGSQEPHDGIVELPDAPPWRRFAAEEPGAQARRFECSDEEIELVNAALYLRRPLLVTGKPGVGKTSLTYAVADELRLGQVLRWSITTQTTLKDGQYGYDAIARLQETSLAERAHRPPPPIGEFLRLGPLGTAFAASDRPRVLLIDEIDKSDIDLPNDLLHIFEEGEFEIPELARLPKDQAEVRILPHDAPEGADVEEDGILVRRGRVHCTHFPLVIMTSNAEREFPPAFLRRCLQLEMKLPDRAKLIRIVRAHLFPQTAREVAFEGPSEADIGHLIDAFLERRDKKNQELAADQLLNAVYLVLKNIDPERSYPEKRALLETLWRSLSG